MTGQPDHAPTLETIFQLALSHMPARTLASAVQLDLFSHLAAGSGTAAEVALAAGADPRGARMLLDGVTALGLLKKSDGRYELTPAAWRYLVKSSPDYMGAMMESDTLWQSWGHLTETVRTGRPAHRVEDQKKAEEFFPNLVRGLHVVNAAPAAKAAKLFAGRLDSGSAVLDVGCGSGVWGLALGAAAPKARLCFQDYPGVLALTREYVERAGMKDRADYLPGNMREVDFGSARFDVALLGNIAHSEGETHSRALFRRLFESLKPGGRLAVIDMIPNEERSGPVFPVLFAINMLVNTEQGDTFTLSEYESWLKGAGFASVETAEIGIHSPLVVGVKAG